MKPASLWICLLLVLSLGTHAEPVMIESARPTLLYFSDVPVSWLPGTAPDEKESFFNWMSRALSTSGAPTLVALDRETLYQEARASGLDPVVLHDSRGGIMHMAFEEPDLETLCEMATRLGIKYVMKVRLPTSSSSISDLEPPESPLAGTAVAFNSLIVENRRVSIQYTVYASADKRILTTREIEIPKVDGKSGFDARVARSAVETIASELELFESGTVVRPGPVALQETHLIWLGYTDGVGYGVSLDLIETERIDNSNVRLTFSLRNELEEKLTIEPVAEDKEELRTYLEDSRGIVYRMTLLESGGKTLLRPGERKDFSLTFKAPPLSVQKVSLKSFWSLSLGEQTNKRFVQLDDLVLHEIAEAPPPVPGPLPANVVPPGR